MLESLRAVISELKGWGRDELIILGVVIVVGLCLLAFALVLLFALAKSCINFVNAHNINAPFNQGGGQYVGEAPKLPDDVYSSVRYVFSFFPCFELIGGDRCHQIP